MRLVERFGLRVGVVIADHVANRQRAGAAARRLTIDHAVNGRGARSVAALGRQLHGGNNVGAFGIGSRWLLIAQRPQKHAWMIAVAPHQIFKLAHAFRV